MISGSSGSLSDREQIIHDQMNKFTVSKSEAGLRVLDFLKEKCGQTLSRRKIKEAVDLGGCLINGKIERYGNVVLRSGDLVELKERKKKHFAFDKQRILFENDDVLAYNKPAGMDCGEASLAILRQYNKNLAFVHRLDKWTTGVLLLSKNEGAKKHLEQLFRNREVEKTYAALVVGKLKASSGIIKNRLGKLREGLWGEVKGGRHAETRWRLIKQKKDFALVECYPITGRTHQIRVHMAGMGHPILGDDRYGQKAPIKDQPEHYLLHAYRIKFNHIEIEAPYPDPLEKIIS